MLYNRIPGCTMVKIFVTEPDAKEFSANTYVLGKIGDPCVIVDLGSTNKAITDYIDSHYEKVAAILLTHAHFDHIRGIPKLLSYYKKKYDIPVYRSEEDIPLLSSPSRNACSRRGEKISRNINPIPVKDGDAIKIGKYTAKVIATPFHTKGSLCYLFEDDNALFTGDTLFAGSIGRRDRPTSQPDKMASSLKKLLSLKPTLVIYPGHGSRTNLGREEKTNPYLLSIENK